MTTPEGRHRRTLKTSGKGARNRGFAGAGRVTAQIVQARKREETALSLRASGASYTEIARTVGYANRSSSARAVKRALGRLGQTEEAEHLRQLEALHLKDIRIRLLRIASRDEEATPTKIAALRELVRVSERFCRLWGLDMTNPLEVTGPNGGPIEHAFRVQALEERIANIHLLPARGELPPPIDADWRNDAHATPEPNPSFDEATDEGYREDSVSFWGKAPPAPPELRAHALDSQESADEPEDAPGHPETVTGPLSAPAGLPKRTNVRPYDAARDPF